MTDQTTDAGDQIKAMRCSLLEQYAEAITSRHRWIIYASGPVNDNEICMTVYDPATEQAKHLTITISDRDNAHDRGANPEEPADVDLTWMVERREDQPATRSAAAVDLVAALRASVDAAKARRAARGDHR